MRALVLVLALGCAPARPPVPDLGAANAELERVLPVLLSAEQTVNAVSVVVVHRRGARGRR